MAAIYDLFKLAAQGVERVPWQYRLLGGAAAGGVIGVKSDNPDMTFGEKISKGMFIGAGLGVGAGAVVRGAGVAVTGSERIGRAAIMNKVSAVRSQGFKALMKPGTLMLGGAVAGAAIAPEGHRTQGAMIGAGTGLAAIPAMKLYKGASMLGKVPGAQTAMLMAAAAGTIAASAVLGKGGPFEAGGVGEFSPGGTIDYAPMSGNMQDRMFAMNASGDIVLGLHGRQHG
jgi:hypothetical protein